MGRGVAAVILGDGVFWGLLARNVSVQRYIVAGSGLGLGTEFCVRGRGRPPWVGRWRPRHDPRDHVHFLAPKRRRGWRWRNPCRSSMGFVPENQVRTRLT